MKHFLLPALILGCLGVSGADAQTFDLISDQLYEPLIGSPSVVDARALSLGGAVTASVQDGSALWYNPAALARIPRIEISGDLVHDRLRGESFPLSLDPLAVPPAVNAQEADLRRTRLGSAYLTLPVPTYRGALTFAAGFTAARSLDRVLGADLSFAAGTYIDRLDGNPSADQIRGLKSTDDQRGLVRGWQVGFGVDVSPRISLGAAAIYYQGRLDFLTRVSTARIRYQDTTFTDSLFSYDKNGTFSTYEDISGWGASLGMLYRPRNDLAFGVIIRSPVRFTIDNNTLVSIEYVPATASTSYEFEDLTTRRLETPLALQVGGAWLYRQWLFALDIAYTDWSQTEYKDSPVLTQYNDALAAAHREEFAVGGGLEWVIPNAATTLRAGLRWAQVPYAERYMVDERLTWSGGIGFLIDQTMALDLAVAHETWRGGNPVFGFDERYGTTRVIATAAYRI